MPLILLSPSAEPALGPHFLLGNDAPALRRRTAARAARRDAATVNSGRGVVISLRARRVGAVAAWEGEPTPFLLQAPRDAFPSR